MQVIDQAISDIAKKNNKQENEVTSFEVANFLAKQIVGQKLPIHGVVKSFTAEEVVNELEDSDTLDDAIMFFKEKK